MGEGHEFSPTDPQLASIAGDTVLFGIIEHGAVTLSPQNKLDHQTTNTEGTNWTLGLLAFFPMSIFSSFLTVINIFLIKKTESSKNSGWAIGLYLKHWNMWVFARDVPVIDKFHTLRRNVVTH